MNLPRLLTSLLMTGFMLTAVGCATTGGSPGAGPAASGDLDFPGSLTEAPVPDGNWRGHQLSRCAGEEAVPRQVQGLLDLSAEFFQEGSGSDGMVEMEMALENGNRHSLVYLTLGQLYLLAGQGEPSLLPVEGPAADVGDWDRNKVRLLARARKLLQLAASQRPDDAVVDYLLADVARAAGNLDDAALFLSRAGDKCTGGKSLALLRFYQQLNRYPARYLGGASPQYPPEALAEGVSGDVTIDLLLDPAGRIRQGVAVDSPAASLTRAAFAALRLGQFEASRVGKYPVWSWLRVTIAFNLES